MEVGYSQDSRTPAVFDLSKYLRFGNNTIALQVYKYSDGSYFEDQDFWRLAGVFRNVNLYWTPEILVRDVFLKPTLVNGYRDGKLDAEVVVENPTDMPRGFKLKGFLFDGKKRLSVAETSKSLDSKNSPSANGTSRAFRESGSGARKRQTSTLSCSNLKRPPE